MWCLLCFSFSVVSVSKVRCSHSYVTIVVWLWHLTLTKSILTCILPRNPNSHTAKIWSGLSKCRNISGIPEEICPGPQLNQEKAATLAQICHRKSVFLAQTLPKLLCALGGERNKLPGVFVLELSIEKIKKDFSLFAWTSMPQLTTRLYSLHYSCIFRQQRLLSQSSPCMT